MTKVYCDRCGKHIEDGTELRVSLSVPRWGISMPPECIEKELCIDCLDYIKSAMTKEAKQSISNRHCDHAGECAGCEIKQVECLAYHNYLAIKYERLSVENARAREKACIQAKRFRNMIIDHEPCWACKRENACKYSHVPECTPCEFEFDESKF